MADRKENQAWTTLSDTKVRHIWRDCSGEEHAIPPTFYEDAGTPVDGETGEDMAYVRTEMATTKCADTMTDDEVDAAIDAAYRTLAAIPEGCTDESREYRIAGAMKRLAWDTRECW